MNYNHTTDFHKSGENAVSKEFYVCPKCKGMEKIKSENNHTGLDICPCCNGFGKLKKLNDKN